MTAIIRSNHVFTDAASGLVTLCFMTTFGTERENLAVLKDYIGYLKKRHDFTVKVVRSDNELPGPQRQEHRSKTDLLSAQGVWLQHERARCGSEPTSLMISRKRWSTWQHIFPRENLGWKTLYEVFYSHTAKLAGIIACPRRHRINCSCLAGKVSSPSLEMWSRPSLSCSVMDEVRHHGQKKRRLRKLDPRAHIGYLVGYDSTNILGSGFHTKERSSLLEMCCLTRTPSSTAGRHT
jgi:hypothetical protein